MTTQEKTLPITEQKEPKGRGLQRYSGGQWLSPFEEVERVFDRFLPRGWLRPWRTEWPLSSELMPFEIRTPRVDMIDREDHILVRAEVPGVKKDDLDVSVTEGTLTIRGEVKHEAEEKEEGDYYHREMSYGSFYRNIPLPAGVDIDKCKVTFKDGILEMMLPKLETAKRRKIEIEEG
jgi:HSP20 family protein